MNNVNTWIEAVEAYVNEAKEVLDETYRFASSSPKSQRNINDVSALLDDILHAVSLSASAAPTSPAPGAAPPVQGEAVTDLLRDALASVEEYRDGLDFGAYDRKLIGRLKAAIRNQGGSE